MLPHHSNPDALAQLPSDVAQSVDAIKAKRLKPTVPQHSRHLRVLCTTWERWVAGCAGSVAVQLQRATLTILLEGQLTLCLRVVLPAAAVLPALALHAQRRGDSTQSAEEVQCAGSE